MNRIMSKLRVKLISDAVQVNPQPPAECRKLGWGLYGKGEGEGVGDGVWGGEKERMYLKFFFTCSFLCCIYSFKIV